MSTIVKCNAFNSCHFSTLKSIGINDPKIPEDNNNVDTDIKYVLLKLPLTTAFCGSEI
jgi:hypothetical protein